MISIVLTSIIIAYNDNYRSNIARAFALVGAMSIVRFRNPVKETRDLVFIFASIFRWLLYRFYMAAILFSILFSYYQFTF